MPRRSRRRTVHALLPFAALLVAVVAVAACSRTDVRLARRILDDHRKKTKSRPLPIAQVLDVELSATGRPPGALRIEWDARRYREGTSSGGVSTVRGIQSGKAYFTDEDGVTRVVSEPVLSELTTRSYFFRRAYLFDDARRTTPGSRSSSSPTAAIRSA
jgi:hypothetical protein